MPEQMQWSSALSTQASLEAAIEQAVQRAKAGLLGEATVGFLFISSAFASEYSRVMPLFQQRLPDVPIVGCGGSGVIGTDPGGRIQEIEDDTILSLTLARLPGVVVQPFHVEMEELPDLDGSPNNWVDLIGVPPESNPQFVVLVDPLSDGITDFLSGLDYAYPGMPKVGGLASGDDGSRSKSSLFCGNRLYRGGAVGIALSGNIKLDTIVAQGCRPIGNPYWVTASERNVILGLRPDGANGDDGTPPLAMLRQMVAELNEEDQELAREALHVGIAQNAFKQNLAPGDFLVRNLLGFDPRQGALAIGDRIRSGQRIQFHLRDASASAEDLEMLMRQYRKQMMGIKPLGALMFSCMGRGKGLYGESNFDSGVFADYLPIPMAGFFCNGEIGPVGGSTFLHGYTVVFGVFRMLHE